MKLHFSNHWLVWTKLCQEVVGHLQFDGICKEGPSPITCWGIYHLSLYSSAGRLCGRVITLCSVLARLTLSSGLVCNPHHAVLAGDHLVAMSVYWSILSVYICELKYSHSAKGQVHAVVRCYITHFLYNNIIMCGFLWYWTMILFTAVDSLHSLYPDLLRRLDDSSDEIRVATAAALFAFIRWSIIYQGVCVCCSNKFETIFLTNFSAFPVDYAQDLYKAHSEALFKALLIHLDDPSTEIQASCLNKSTIHTCAILISLNFLLRLPFLKFSSKLPG